MIARQIYLHSVLRCGKAYCGVGRQEIAPSIVTDTHKEFKTSKFFKLVLLKNYVPVSCSCFSYFL